jgi:glutaredoxin 3
MRRIMAPEPGRSMATIDVYTIPYCPYCADAKDLLARKGVPFHEISASGDYKIRKEMMDRADGRSTFPQIFIGGTHVGGCDDLYALDEAGKLDPLLAAVKDETPKEQPA